MVAPDRLHVELPIPIVLPGEHRAKSCGVGGWQEAQSGSGGQVAKARDSNDERGAMHAPSLGQGRPPINWRQGFPDKNLI